MWKKFGRRAVKVGDLPIDDHGQPERGGWRVAGASFEGRVGRQQWWDEAESVNSVLGFGGVRPGHGSGEWWSEVVHWRMVGLRIRWRGREKW